MAWDHPDVDNDHEECREALETTRRDAMAEGKLVTARAIEMLLLEWERGTRTSSNTCLQIRMLINKVL